MPLLGNGEYREPFALNDQFSEEPGARTIPERKQSQHSITARLAMNKSSLPNTDVPKISEAGHLSKNEKESKSSGMSGENNLVAPTSGSRQGLSNGAALTDTPMTTAPNSPNM